jgi:phosphoglycerate transport regulatory protein PgtC
MFGSIRKIFDRCKIMAQLALLSVAVLALSPIPVIASTDLTGRLIIITSFPEKLFSRFKSAFERRHSKVKIHIRSKKTSAAISFIQEHKGEPADIVWASAPDAFEVLKKSGHLAKAFDVPAEKIVLVGGYPVDDPGGYYRGFAISGYGIMWNRPYLAQLGLPEPRQWDDLRRPKYFRHLGISAPSRSGTMHLIIETILQGKGWVDGWATLLEIGGNLATVTARSFGVLDGVNRGRFGAGPVIDFFGLSAMATGAPVGFTYPNATAFLPANIALVKGGGNPGAAKAFVDFILSPAGQSILLEPEISRLPVRAETYKDGRPDYPNPFDNHLTRKGIRFNTELSRTRYHLVNTLFDTVITYRLKGLSRTWKAIHDAEAAVELSNYPNLQKRLQNARRLASQIPVNIQQASDPGFTSRFVRRKPGLPVPIQQVNLEEHWERFVRDNHIAATRIAEEVLAELAGRQQVTKP